MRTSSEMIRVRRQMQRRIREVVAERRSARHHGAEGHGSGSGSDLAQSHAEYGEESLVSG